MTVWTVSHILLCNTCTCILHTFYGKGRQFTMYIYMYIVLALYPVGDVHIQVHNMYTDTFVYGVQ